MKINNLDLLIVQIKAMILDNNPRVVFTINLCERLLNPLQLNYVKEGIK